MTVQLARGRTTIPLFGRRPRHSSVPASIRAAAARSFGQGRPDGRRASASPWTEASTAARSIPIGRAIQAIAFAALTLLLWASVPAVAEPAPPSPHEIIAAEGPFAGFVREAAQRFGIPAPWIEAVMRAESAGDVRAVSPKGAMGLMQIMPATWAELRARYDLGADPYDPRDNILAGAAYLREMHDRFGSPGFLAAYHAGPGRYEEHLLEGRPLPRETRDYVAALAPIVGASAGAAVLTVSLDSEVWMRAPLFVARAGAVVEARRESSPQDRTTADLSALAPQTADLFVRRRAEAASP